MSDLHAGVRRPYVEAPTMRDLHAGVTIASPRVIHAKHNSLTVIVLTLTHRDT